jgi:putative Ca2+/H+ antiporter (TMEM165/GDT1 family)
MLEPLLSALALVFVAELGDKTQLVALGLGARYRLVPVMIGVVLGYAATNLLSVVIGGLLGAALPTQAVGIGGGILFLVFAIWTLRSGDAHDRDEGLDGPAAVAGGRVVLTVALAMFVAELGDKTMLATATLAAASDPVLVWMGATIGIVLAGLLGVLVGRFFGAHLPERAVRIGSAVLFAIFGIALIVTNIQP